MSKGWRNTILVLVALWLVWAGFGNWIYNNQDVMLEWVTSRAATGGQRQTMEGNLPSSGISTLRIRSTNSIIELRPADDSQLRYEATLWGWGKDAQDKIRSMDVKAEVQGDTIVIESVHRSKSVSNAGINYVIYVPHGMSIDLSLINGTVKGEALVVNGHDIALALVNGTVDLRLAITSGAELATSVTNGKVIVDREEVTLSNVSQDSKSYQALVNGGGPTVKATAVNGVVKLKLK